MDSLHAVKGVDAQDSRPSATEFVAGGGRHVGALLRPRNGEGGEIERKR